MFQCAAAIGYAKKYNVGWACPNDTREFPNFHKFFPNLPRYDGHEFKRFNAADPSQFNYWPIPFNQNGLKLVGFFQSEKYFEGAHDEVRKVFKLKINPNESTSLHIRRGDYVHHSNSFPPVNLDYVSKSFELLKQRGVSIDNIMVFSDDINWCRSLLPYEFRNQWFEFSEGRTEFEDLSLMASCSHHIIANSTFSWWGAWLGNNPNKIVVSPSADNWFGPGFTGGIPKDIIPSNWHQIKFR
jgi:hypothetical protein